MDNLRLNISVLTEESYQTLRTAVEKLLWDVGFSVNNQTVLQGFEKAGAPVDYSNNHVKLPPALLWELASKAPGAFDLSGMNGDIYQIGKGGPFHAAIVTDPWIADYPSGEMRRPCLRDVIRNTRVIQSKPEVCFTSLMDFPVTDVPGLASRYRAQEAHLLNHSKPYAVYCTSYESFLEWLKIGSIVKRGGDLTGSNLFIVAVAVISPLKLESFNCKILLECIKYGFPVTPTVCPMSGSTSPYTFAGTLVQGLAENLIALCASQALSPGHPFLFGLGTSVTEMQYGRDHYYTTDKALFKIAAVEFGKRLGLPTAAETGGAFNGRYDMQAGAEGMLMTLSALMSGADILAGAGSCLNANGLSAEFILSHYTFLDAAAHLKNGYPMNELDRSMDSIREQGIGGNFLTDDLTLEKLRDSEFFQTPMFDESGEHGSGKSMLERVHEEANRIEESFISPVPDDIAGALRNHFDKICSAF